MVEPVGGGSLGTVSRVNVLNVADGAAINQKLNVDPNHSKAPESDSKPPQVGGNPADALATAYLLFKESIDFNAAAISGALPPITGSPTYRETGEAIVGNLIANQRAKMPQGWIG